MKLLVQTYLDTHSLAELREQHGVKHRWSTKRPGVLTLNYDQLAVCDTDPLSQECRGLVLRALGAEEVSAEEAFYAQQPIGETEIVALPFARFFNHGTGPCADVDLSSARFYEKLDGTLCIVHHDRGEWHVATRGVPDADVAVDGNEHTFRSLFELALRECGEATGTATALGEGLDPERTYLFELVAPENQVVVRYEERSVSLLGIRHRVTGAEYPPEVHADLYLICPSHPVEPATLSAFVHERDPLKHEGLVVCDDQFRRAKVKSAGYLALAHARDGVGRSDRRLLEVALSGRQAAARQILPPYLVEKLARMELGLDAFFARTDAWYEANVCSDRKGFALRITAEGAWMSCHMSRWSRKCTDSRSYVESMKRDGSWPDAFLDVLLAGTGMDERAERAREAA